MLPKKRPSRVERVNRHYNWGFQPVTIFAKTYISDVWLGCEYASGEVLSFYTDELLHVQYFSRVGANTKTSIKYCFHINSLKGKQEKQRKNNQMTFFGWHSLYSFRWCINAFIALLIW